MISNLRAKPIEGFITDSAGNVLRNSNIVISRNSPSGLVTVNRVESDDQGYFISSPLPNGVYDIFESGVRTSRVMHRPDSNAIQCFKASTDNYYESDIIPFSQLITDSEINSFKYFLQIEPENISVDVLGNTFPVYDIQLSNLQVGAGDLYYMDNFFNFRANSRITIPRFDVEFFVPLTASQTSYKRIKWAGVPGVRFKSDSKIIVPLDYMSIVANRPFIISNNGNNFGSSEVYIFSTGTKTVTIKGQSSVSEYTNVYNKTGIGDIIYFTTATKEFYGVVRP